MRVEVWSRALAGAALAVHKLCVFSGLEGVGYGHGQRISHPGHCAEDDRRGEISGLMPGGDGRYISCRARSGRAAAAACSVGACPYIHGARAEASRRVILPVVGDQSARKWMYRRGAAGSCQEANMWISGLTCDCSCRIAYQRAAGLAGVWRAGGLGLHHRGIGAGEALAIFGAGDGAGCGEVDTSELV